MPRLLRCLAATALCGSLSIAAFLILFDLNASQLVWRDSALLLSLVAGAAGLAVFAHARAARRRRRANDLIDVARHQSFEELAAAFVANLSHELRTPMAIIIGYLQLIEYKSLDWNRARAYLEPLTKAADRLNWVIDTLVLTAQLESGRRPPKVALCDVGAELDALAMQWNVASDGRVRTRAYGMTTEVFLDWELVSAALNQLIDNALKFSDQPVEVVAAILDAGESTILELAVHDTGIGLDDRAVAALWKDFQQGDGSTTRSYGGLGLGLGLVRRIADACGATIEMASELECGSTFRLRMSITAATGADLVFSR